MTFLHRLYRLSGLLSATALVLICVLIMAQVIARNFGSTVRDAEEFAAWAMAAAGFLGLPYALHCGSHIRVEVVMRFIPQRLHQPMEVLVSVIGLLLAAYLAWYCTAFVIESYQFNEVSQGLIAVPLWLPQLPMAIGTILLVVAFGERLVRVLRHENFEIGAGEARSE
ncbi:TRAP transporter small permease [Noviherbaspirillum sp. Root189]|uniref:TRAP transporter small permease n=1 Tax=Noviherbaspirillum sp. Root189 TaxID=1736487 RepID=UPI00070DE383|nr:TRAP transporter small permease [Noviherbaspirillum sp. Root189]KRB86995.1 TRAP dicarboxylate transporter subunit DctQ [Noviherbaspirillum sp. Root189]